MVSKNSRFLRSLPENGQCSFNAGVAWWWAFSILEIINHIGIPMKSVGYPWYPWMFRVTRPLLRWLCGFVASSLGPIQEARKAQQMVEAQHLGGYGAKCLEHMAMAMGIYEYIKTAWWFGTSILFLPYIGNFIIPSDELIFFRGVSQPPTYQKDSKGRWGTDSKRPNWALARMTLPGRQPSHVFSRMEPPRPTTRLVLEATTVLGCKHL